MVPLDMEIPPPDASCWTDLLCAATVPACQALAVQMMVFRLRQSVGIDASSGNLARASGELHAFFTTQGHLPAIQEDLASICGGRP